MAKPNPTGGWTVKHIAISVATFIVLAVIFVLITRYVNSWIVSAILAGFLSWKIYLSLTSPSTEEEAEEEPRFPTHHGGRE